MPVQISEEYEQVSQLQEINEKVSYLYKEIMGQIYVIYADTKYGPYTQATFARQFKDGIAYFASEKMPTDEAPQVPWTVYIDGKKASEEYLDAAAPILEQDDLPVFTAKTNEGWFLIKGDKQLAGPYPAILNLKQFNEDFLFGAKKANGKWSIITVKSGEIIEGPEYERVGSPVVVNNKVAYPAQKKTGVQLMVYDGQELTPYEEIGRVMIYNNQLVYTAKKADKEYVLVIDAKEYGPYSMIGLTLEHDGKVAYAAMGTEKPEWEVYINGEQATDFALQSNGIGWLTNINDKLSYVYVNKRNWCSVRIGLENLPKEFLTVKYLTDFKGQPAFAAGFGREAPKWKLVINHEEVSEEYADITIVRAIKDKLYAIALKDNRRMVVIQVQ